MSREHNTVPRRLRFGTVDWRQPGYYPDDLPRDWQLGYYANELSAVLLPVAGWRDVAQDQLAEWAEDVHPGFRFYLLADAGVPIEAQLARATALGDRLGALLWPSAPAPAADPPSRGGR